VSIVRKWLPLSLGFLFGVFGLAQFYSPHPAIVDTYAEFLDWVQVIFAFTLIVGVVSLFAANVKKIAGRERYWAYSIVTLIALVTMASFGLFGGTDTGSAFTWVFNNVQVPMQSTVFALLAFFVASAAYRGFRLRNLQAGVLLSVAIIIMLGRVPVGELITPLLPDAAEWILSVPAMSAKRAVLIGIGLGSITTALRVILGIERSYLGRN